MSLPLVGKFLQASLIFNIIGMLRLIRRYRNTLPFFHSVRRLLALSNIIYPPLPFTHYGLDTVVLFLLFLACLNSHVLPYIIPEGLSD